MEDNFDILHISSLEKVNPINSLRVFHVETTWKRLFTCRLNVEYT